MLSSPGTRHHAHRCPFRYPIYRHSGSSNVTYGGKKSELNVCLDHVGSRWITKSVHCKSACRHCATTGSILPLATMQIIELEKSPTTKLRRGARLVPTPFDLRSHCRSPVQP